MLWIIFAGITATALIAVLWPVLLGNKDQKSGELSFDAAVFKDQLEEIDAELERGLVSKSEAESAKTEVSRRLLAATRARDAGRTGQSVNDNGKIAGIALAAAFILVPVTSSALYLKYGSPGLSDQPLIARLSKPASGQNVETLVAQVEARLREHPQDGRGWEVIAPVYLRQRRFADAADAFGQVIRILGETPNRLSDYGNALILAQDGVVSEPARKVLQRAVSKDTNLMRAHFWLAVAHEQDGNAAKAVSAWRDLLGRSDADAPWRDAVQQRLAAMEKLADGRPNPEISSKPKRTAPGSELRGPTSEDVSAAGGMSATDRAAMIGGMVAGLSERLRTEGGSIEEWKRLVRSYMVLGKNEDAKKALTDARAAFAQKPGQLAEINELAASIGLKDNP